MANITTRPTPNAKRAREFRVRGVKCIAKGEEYCKFMIESIE